MMTTLRTRLADLRNAWHQNDPLPLWNIDGYDRRVDSDEDATHVEIPLTAWGDYHGSTCERANHAVLMEDWEDIAHDLRLGYGSHAVLLALDEGVKGDRADELVSTLDALTDYPVLDGSAWAEVELLVERESWELREGSDFRRMVLAEIVGPEGNEDDADDLVPTLLGDLWSLVERTDGWEQGETTWECEGATSAYLVNADGAAREVAALIMRDYLVPAVIDGQGILP